jgi:hypothetical protein
MEIRFVKKPGQRDRCWVTHPDQTQTSWAFPSYGAALPHDLVHYVVERAFGLERGLWGLVALGVDIQRVNDESNRAGGKVADKYADLGDLTELIRAEELAAHDWDRPFEGDEAKRAEVRRELDALLARWRDLGPEGTLVLEW